MKKLTFKIGDDFFNSLDAEQKKLLQTKVQTLLDSLSKHENLKGQGCYCYACACDPQPPCGCQKPAPPCPSNTGNPCAGNAPGDKCKCFVPGPETCATKLCVCAKCVCAA